MLIMERDDMRQQNANSEVDAIYAEYYIMTTPTHGQTTSSSNISNPQYTPTDPRNNIKQRENGLDRY